MNILDYFSPKTYPAPPIVDPGQHGNITRFDLMRVAKPIEIKAPEKKIVFNDKRGSNEGETWTTTAEFNGGSKSEFLNKRAMNKGATNMSIATMILGESGTGKSTSLRNLDPQHTLLIQLVKKPLPFRSSDWKPCTKDSPGGSVLVNDNSASIVAAMQRTKRDIIVLDDFQYLLANEFMRRVTDLESGSSAFQKYNEIARHAWDVLMASTALPDNKRVYILSHTSTDDFGKTKIKTIGKLLDEKIVMEGLVTIVLKTVVQNGNYLFSTKNSGADTVKSPLGMFDNDLIDNDLAAVDAQIFNYYGLQESA